MKKIAMIILFLTASVLSAFTQKDDFRTIMGHKPFKVSGFGGPLMYVNVIDKDASYMLGGGLGLLFNNFYAGIYGMQLTSPFLRVPRNFDYEQGGIWLGYCLKKNRIFHPAFGIQSGLGLINTNVLEGTGRDYVYVINPYAELEINVTRFLRFGAGINYSAAIGTDQSGYKNKDFSSPGAIMSLKFGWF